MKLFDLNFIIGLILGIILTAYFAYNGMNKLTIQAQGLALIIEANNK